ncbi:MAG: hypothetical protein CL532_04555 [Aestuariivita sp.]|nr:hypothetical protein [Aestuariivita sp.]
MKNLTRRLLGRFYWVTYSSALSYKGAWKNGLFDGKGELKYSNGTHFSGTFFKGHKHGKGTLVSSGGYRYEGDWVNGRKTGFASIRYKNGDGFVGEVKDGLRHGTGQLHDAASQLSFKGRWHQDVICGDVRISSATWCFTGPMPNGEGLTQGEMKYSDNSIYSGSLKDFMHHGDGILNSSTGECIDGIWAGNFNVHKATKKDKSGVYWKGNLRDLKPQGYMHVKLPNGQEYDGIWENGSMLRALSVKNRSGQVSPYYMH